MAKVWSESYSQYGRITICATAIGNDIPWEIAEAVERYNAVLDYHPYIVCRVGKITLDRKAWRLFAPVQHNAPRARFRGGGLYKMREFVDDSANAHMRADALGGFAAPDYVSPHDWRWYSGRWATMDAEFVARGIHVDWAFGEGGPVLDASEDWSGWLDPLGGWKNKDCLNGDLEKYKAVLDYWLQNTFQTPAYQEGRILGLQLFTSGAPGGSGGQWGNFDLIGDDMQEIASFSGLYDYPPVGDPPPPPPPAEDCEGLPRTQYNRRVIVVPQDATATEWALVCETAYQNKQTVTFSYDDAGIGALTGKTAILYGLAENQHSEFTAWYAEHYPCTVVEFRDYSGGNGNPRIINITDGITTHDTKTYSTRDLDGITDLIIHHTVSSDQRTADQIAAYHVHGKGWPGIGYHFVIGANGTIEQVNELETISYHASAANSYSVGIALKGDFTTEHPTDEQIASVVWLVDWLRDTLNNVEVVYGHKEAEGAATACPGNTWLEWKDKVISG